MAKTFLKTFDFDTRHLFSLKQKSWKETYKEVTKEIFKYAEDNNLTIEDAKIFHIRRNVDNYKGVEIKQHIEVLFRRA